MTTQTRPPEKEVQGRIRLPGFSASPHLTPAERVDRGMAARAEVPPEWHSQLGPADERPDPVTLLEGQAQSRLQELIPIRYGRMLASPFAFYRGAAAVMACDLSQTPVSGLLVQACGDAHVSNFGMFASPERRLMFDINDFDETHPGPWEWDVKRLAASLMIAGRENNYTKKECRKVVRATVRRYQAAMARFARMSELDVWYARVDQDSLREFRTKPLTKAQRKRVQKQVSKARTKDSVQAYRKFIADVDGQQRIIGDPPLIVPISDLLPVGEEERFELGLHELLRRYRRTLHSDLRTLIDRYVLVDVARKVVGVGSVGTRCWIAFLTGRDRTDPLFLQVKEAQRSVIADYFHAPGTSSAQSEGRRVVSGQRLMQASSDIFLGWESNEDADGFRRDYYIRQLRDWKGSTEPESLQPKGLGMLGQLCAWTLARAHARTGDRIAIAAYLGDDDAFVDAIVQFCEQYADQNDRDIAALAEAARIGRIEVQIA